MKAVLLAAGLGKRIQPITNGISKCMLPVANKPILEWTYSFIQDIVDEIIIVVRNDQKDIIERFNDRCTIIYQEKPLGTADALACCEPHLNDNFLLMYSDEMFMKDDIHRFVSCTDTQIACHNVMNPQNYGVLTLNDNMVTNITEKPENPESSLVNSGMYVLPNNIFKYMRKIQVSQRNEYEITNALKMMVQEGYNLKPFKVSKWHTITYPWNILDMNQMILDQFGSQIGDCEIRPGAYIEDPISIGDGAIIGPNCYIRKYSSIGRNCKIGNAVEIKNSIIMDNSFVSHLSYVGDTLIGSNCNIGAGTIFANLRLDDKTVKMHINGNIIDSGRKKLGGIIGNNVKFGVNCVVMPGKKIWPEMYIPPCSKITKDIEVQPDWKVG